MKRSEPPLWLVGFRPFIVLACLAGTVLPAVWAMMFSGLLSSPSMAFSMIQWHAHEMLFGFGWAVLGGFIVRIVMPQYLPSHNLLWIDVSAACWLAGFALLAWRYIPFLMSARIDGGALSNESFLPLSPRSAKTACACLSSFVIEQGLQNHEQLSFFKTHMGRQAFGKRQHRRSIGLLQLSAEVPQFPVIAHDVLDEFTLTSADKQRQQGVFLNNKMRLKFAAEYSASRPSRARRSIVYTAYVLKIRLQVRAGR